MQDLLREQFSRWEQIMVGEVDSWPAVAAVTERNGGGLPQVDLIVTGIIMRLDTRQL